MKTAHGFQIGMLLACCCVVLVVKAAAAEPAKKPIRYGKVIGVKAEKLDEYKRLHADVWPEVEQAMHDANIRNMSIYLRKLPDGKHYLFMYFEYIGQDFEGDMKKMAEDPATCSSGGSRPIPARSRCRTASPATGGPTWKKSATSGDADH